MVEDQQEPIRDVVGGDQIDVNNIVGSKGVAIGRDARVEIHETYGDIIVRVDDLKKMGPVHGPPPYKGLTYFTEEDEHLFFGRKALSEKIANRLQNTHFLAVIGASGSGKSSLLRAGVVPRLRRQNWSIRIFTPAANPITQLANALISKDAPSATAAAMEKALLENPEELHLSANRLAVHEGVSNILFIIDQFEELFTL